ncbi:Glycosyltransferase [hydrothermal vent metagenome]|uniref:Glycosyltransferase n=1 Tax=hydrothermal vent metagenome TaxID=652676 RepID=A0A1W1CZS1_9ZZZZ
MNWQKEYVSVLEHMHRLKDASRVMKKITDKSKNANDWFLYGYFLEKINNKSLAMKAYKKAIELDKDKNAKQYGIGIFFEKKGLWSEAKEKYAQSIKKKPLNAKLRGRYALSYEKLYEWEKAEEEYLRAIGLDMNEIPWYYKLGFVRERQGAYEKAAEAYEYAAKNRKTHTPYWYYRLGCVLVKLKKYEESTNAFLMMKNLNKSELISNNLQEDIKKFSLKAIESNSDFVKNELIRENKFDSDLYFELGDILTYKKLYKEASELFLKQRIMQDAHGVIEAPFNKDKVLRNLVTYTEFYENLPIEDNIILYESYHGSAMSCSPYAIFKFLLDDKRFSDYLHIWVVNDENSIKLDYKKYSNVIFIKKNSDLYMRYLATAKYLINNTTFPDWYIRKKNQVYLNTWHGTPIKTLGRDVENDFMAHRNQTKNFLQTSHLIAPNPHTAKVLEESYDIKDIYTGALAITGYPRQDLMLNISDEEKNAIYETLKIDKSKKIVLYAPTWRGTVSGATFDTQQLENDIQYLSTLKDVEILFRGHYMVEKFLEKLNIDITVVPSTIDTNSLLSIVDILITDYSSICFDFMAMDKPIIYYIYDKEEYLKERGLYFEVETIGDYICYDINEVKESIENILKNTPILQLQKKAKSDFCAYDDGLATKRVVDLIFFNKTEEIEISKQEEKESILIYGGPLMANGITTSFINLCNLIDKSKYSITITFDPNAVLLEDVRVEQFNKFHKDIKVVPRFGRMLMTLEERELISRFNSGRGLYGSEMWDIFEYAHKREFKRVFGYGKFDHIVNFEGYTVFWSLLMGMKLEGVKSNAIYQHNDLYAEYKMKYPYLKQTFETYRFYDKIVSVSEKTKEHNRENLSKNFKVDSNKFIHCDNVQDIENILEKSKEEIAEESHKNIFKNGKVFINIGRLSPEKGHIKLINAFTKVHQKYPKVCLVNLGSGVLEKEIQLLIKKLKLENNVFYLGQVSNPYSYLNASDCFILPSDHEGQPMTLLEALILKKPIIATDIVGNRSVLENRPGLLVENSEEGVYKGMIDFIEGNYKEEKLFDEQEYNHNALNMFYGKVL